MQQTKPTILIVTEWHSPISEIEVFVEGLVANIADNYLVVLAVRLHNKGELPVVAAKNIDLHHFKSTSELKGLIRKILPKLVHFQQCTKLAVATTGLLRRLKIPVIVTLHYGPSVTTPSTSPFRPHPWSYIRKLNNSHLLVAPSPQINQLARENGVIMSGTIISVGVDTNRYQPGSRMAARVELGLPKDQPLILLTGHPDDLNLTAAMHAMARLDAVLSATIITVGLAEPNSLTPLLSQLASRGRYSNLIEIDHYDERHPLIYQAADLFISPASYAGQNLPSLEAMASALRIIRPDEIDVTLTEQATNTALHQAYGAANRRQALELDITKTAAAYNKLYAKLIGYNASTRAI